jgi:hypothetical protein
MNKYIVTSLIIGGIAIGTIGVVRNTGGSNPQSSTSTVI